MLLGLTLRKIARLTGLVSTVALIAASPTGAFAGSPPTPVPARPADVTARAVVSHGPGVPDSGGRVAIPLRRGPLTHGGLSPQTAPSAVSAPKTALSAGVNQEGLVALGGTPSDSTGSIGPLHYIEMVNSQVGMYDRSLNPLALANLNVFVGATTGAQTGDVQVQWDQQAGHWLYVSLETYGPTNNNIAFGWSKAGDLSTLTLINSDWCNFHISTGSFLHDYPKLGHDANFILIGANVFDAASNLFKTGSIWAIPKPAIGDASCTPPMPVQFGTAANPLFHHAPNGMIPIFTPVPGNTTDSGATAYISAIDIAIIGILHVSRTGVGTCVAPPCLVNDGDIPITPWNPGTGFQVPQPAPNQNLDALDGRLTQAVQHVDPRAGGAEAVWTQHTTQGAGGRTVVTWFELIPSVCASGVCAASAKRQEGTLSDPNLYLFNAAISPTSNGDAAIIHYNTGSSTSFNDVRAQSHDAADSLNTMAGEFILRRSTVADADFSCTTQGGPPCRWGDYSGASPDPTNCSTV